MRTGLNGETPLIPPMKYNAKCQLALYVDCPLSGSDDVMPLKNCSNLEQVIARCIVLEVLCGRLAKLKNTTPGYNKWITRTSEAYLDVCNTLKLVGALDVKSYLKDNNILKLFPYVETFVSNDLLACINESPLISHLSSFAKLSQVLQLVDSMVSQLQEGCFTNMAHQFSLLYRTLGGISSSCLHRYQTEGGLELFDQLKSELEQYSTLTVDTQELLIVYLTNLSRDIMESVNTDTSTAAFFEAAGL